MQFGLHPDRQQIDDWINYGPRDGKIAELVIRLAVDRGMRLADIEEIILNALQCRLDQVEEKK